LGFTGLGLFRRQAFRRRRLGQVRPALGAKSVDVGIFGVTAFGTRNHNSPSSASATHSKYQKIGGKIRSL
jgi:hypothetical protein